MARSQNSEQDDFKIMLKVQCSYFYSQTVFYINLIKISSFNETIFKNFCNHPPKKRNNIKIIDIKKTPNYKSHLSESITWFFPLSSQLKDTV